VDDYCLFALVSTLVLSRSGLRYGCLLKLSVLLVLDPFSGFTITGDQRADICRYEGVREIK
jgi:hypothetical protein